MRSELTLRPQPDDVRTARAFCLTKLATIAGPGEIGEDFLDAAAMITTELVVNAINAGASLIRLTLDPGEEFVVISVVDDAHGSVVPTAHNPMAVNGRGLRIIANLSRRWGVSPVADGKTVWAELDLPANAETEEIAAMPDSRATSETVLTMTGDIDIVNEHQWRRRGGELLDANPDLCDLTADMSQVGFIDSRGLAVLVSLHATAVSRGGRLSLVSVPRRVMTALVAAGLDQVFSISPA